MGITRDIAGFGHELSYETLPPEIVDRVKYLALDYLGLALRGAAADSSQAVHGFIAGIAPASGKGTVIGAPIRAPYQYAALANGAAGHALELDDVSNESSSHPAVVVFPAALAAAEMSGGDGRRFVEAVVLGYEIMIRVGMALDPAAHYARGFHPTGTCGNFGAVMVAAKIFGLDLEQTVNALGIAGSQAAGLMEFLNDGSWSKRLHPGWAAHNGIIAARLAASGFTGPATVLEGEFGFLRAYSDKAAPEKLVAGLGETYKVMRASIKPYACCRYKQGPIDSIIKIMREHNLQAADVAGIRVGVLTPGFSIIVEPREIKYHPRTVYEAQFSMPFGAACAVLYGNASLNEYTEARINSPEVQEMMSKVTCVTDPELDRAYPAQWPATAVITTHDGREFSTRVDYPKGDPENPLSWEELIAKFDDMAAPVASVERRREIVARVRALEALPDILSLTGLLVTD